MLDDVGMLAARSVLATAGVDVTKIKFEQVAFDQMPQTLQADDADAALMIEPYITRAEKDLGAHILADGARGSTLDFPLSAYASAKPFAQANPRTLAAFRTALGTAQQNAADPADRPRRPAEVLRHRPDHGRADLARLVPGVAQRHPAAARRRPDAQLRPAGDRLDVQGLLPDRTSY